MGGGGGRGGRQRPPSILWFGGFCLDLTQVDFLKRTSRESERRTEKSNEEPKPT